MSNITPLKIFTVSIIAIVGTVMIIGMFVAGSPSNERNRRFDVQRVDNLRSLQHAIDEQYNRTGVLPARLEGQDWVPQELLNDPETGERYAYLVMNESNYQLCATFTGPSEDDELMGKPGRVPSPVGGKLFSWEHPAGHFCFDLDASTTREGNFCNAKNPCLAGQTCALLPGAENAICVAEGQECRAANCPEDSCEILESYPVQVRCSEETARANDSCQLMQHKSSGKVGCYGCANGVCVDPPQNWALYTAPSEDGYIGIPYACFTGPSGCELAQ